MLSSCPSGRLILHHRLLCTPPRTNPKKMPNMIVQALVQLRFMMVMLHADVDEALRLMEASKERLRTNNGKDMVRAALTRTVRI